MDLQNHSQNQSQQSNNNSGLLRFRSAPTTLLNANSNDSLVDERLYTRFMSGDNELDSVNFHDFEDKSAVAVAGGRGDLVMGCGSELLPQYPRQSSGMEMSSPVSVNGLYGGASLSRSNNLARQSSSPAGFFSQLDAQNGFDTTRGARSFRVENPREVSSSASRLGLLSRISEIDGNESNEANSSDDVKLDNHNSRFYGSAFPFSSWTDSVQFMEDDEKFFSPTQSGDQSNRGRVLSHHLSLPKNSVELATMERLMQFQDSVPCKVRAKRGCATHPRSIAERVRRTRISERMRKLQELVPNMDKQTNTSDMLDLAVDYIKDLQKQFKTLTDTRAKCKCLHIQRSIAKQAI